MSAPNEVDIALKGIKGLDWIARKRRSLIGWTVPLEIYSTARSSEVMTTYVFFMSLINLHSFHGLFRKEIRPRNGHAGLQQWPRSTNAS